MRWLMGTPGTPRRGVSAAAGALVLVAVLLVVIVSVPAAAVDARGLSRNDWLTHVESLRGSILQGLGGLALLGTLYFSARTLGLNRRGQLTERFSRAIEQLGHREPDGMSVRLGGIYALEQIALDSEELYWPVMEVLAAFLRTAAGDEATAATARPWLAEPPRWERDRTPARADVQAIATVLGRRPDDRRRRERAQRRTLQLRFADLSRVSLIGAHLEEARLTGANLRDANLREARLERASLRAANLTDAHLRGADLTGAELVGADLAGAELDGAVLDGANLDETNLTHAQLAGARVDASTILPERLRATAATPPARLPGGTDGAAPAPVAPPSRRRRRRPSR